MSLLNWPTLLDRTPEGDRESGNQFDVNYRRTKSQVKDEMRLMEVDNWRIDDVTGSGGDPGVVLRWEKAGQEYAVACDGYTSKRANLREVYLWVNETRMREQRKARTVRDEFAAAALPPGDEEAERIVAAAPAGPPAHEVLGVAPDADPEVIRQVGRALMAKYKPGEGSDPNAEKFKSVKDARDRLLD